jgi:hypothetical protein
LLKANFYDCVDVDVYRGKKTNPYRMLLGKPEGKRSPEKHMGR